MSDRLSLAYARLKKAEKSEFSTFFLNEGLYNTAFFNCLERARTWRRSSDHTPSGILSSQ